MIETVARQPWVLAPQGRDDGHLLRRHQPALRRRHRPAAPRRDRAALGDRQHRRRRCTRAASSTPASRSRWAEDRVHDALPASPTGGQPWAYQRIQNGDTTCKANQDLHPEAVNLIAKIRANNYYRPKVADPLSPITFVHKIHVPVFLACQWTDEQTGGHCPTWPRTSPAPSASGSPSPTASTSTRWTPRRSTAGTTSSSSTWRSEGPSSSGARRRSRRPCIYDARMGIAGVTLPPDPIQAEPSYAAALAAFQALPPVRILFDNGAGGSTPGAPVPGLRALVLALPGARDPGAAPGTSGDGGALTPASPRPAPSDRSPGTQGARRRPTSPATRRRPGRAVDRRRPPTTGRRTPPGTRRVLRERAARAPTRRDRRRRACRLWIQVLGPQRRPAGDGLRGAARRQGDVRAERLAARQRAQAGRRAEHAAGAGAEPAQAPTSRRCPKGRYAKVTVPAVLRGPRLPQAARGSG